MTRPRTKPTKVYRLLDGDPDVHAVIRYSGDPDEFTALAHAWLAEKIDRSVFFDYPIAVEPPQLRWFRHNPYDGDDYSWTLGTPTGPGRGNWQGSYLKVVRIGCSQCRYLHGAHHPGGCLNANIVGLQTCQMTPGGLEARARRKAEQMIHLVRVRGRVPGNSGGTPGPTLCDLDRFGPGVSFSMGGGATWEGMNLRACYMCVRVAQREFPNAPVTTSMREFAQLFVDQNVPVSKNWADRLTPTLGTPGAWALQPA
jgi:hypothetical protein